MQHAVIIKLSFLHSRRPGGLDDQLLGSLAACTDDDAMLHYLARCVRNVDMHPHNMHDYPAPSYAFLSKKLSTLISNSNHGPSPPAPLSVAAASYDSFDDGEDIRAILRDVSLLRCPQITYFGSTQAQSRVAAALAAGRICAEINCQPLSAIQPEQLAAHLRDLYMLLWGKQSAPGIIHAPYMPHRPTMIARPPGAGYLGIPSPPGFASMPKPPRGIRAGACKKTKKPFCSLNETAFSFGDDSSDSESDASIVLLEHSDAESDCSSRIIDD